MLDVIICEDDQKQRGMIEKIVKDTVLIENLDMKISLVTNNPDEVLDYVRNHKIVGLYFLDIDLKHDLTGIGLASKIREYDSHGKIVFVTTHGELSYLTFTYKVEALDFIIKDHPEGIKKRIRDCILYAQDKYIQENSSSMKKFVARLGDTHRSFDYDEIMFFESSSSPHKIILHLDDSQLELTLPLKEVEELDSCFFKCHKSVIVNKNNIESVDKATRKVIMKNGEVCYSSLRNVNKLIK